MLKLLLKIWPALTPIVIYFLWIFFDSLVRKFIDRNIAKKNGESD